MVSKMPAEEGRLSYPGAGMTSHREQDDARTFRNRTLVVAGVLLGVAVAIWLAHRLANLLFMIFVSVFVAVAFEPPVHFLEKRGWKRGLATGVVLLVALLVFIGFTAALAPLFIAQIGQLVEAIPDYLEALLAFLSNNLGIDLDFDPQSIGEEMIENLQNFGGILAGGLISVGASVAGFVFFAATVALFSFFMIAELPKLQRTVLSFMPETQQRRALRIWDVAVEKMGGYIYSRLVLAVISGAVAAAALGLLGVPFAVPLGIWVGVLSQFVPVVGTYLAMVFPAVVALTFNDTSTLIWVLVIFIAYQQVENYLFAPYITKRTMEIHPAVSVGAIIAGASLLGGVGVLLALPMTGIIQAIISESRRSYDVVLDRSQTDPDGDQPSVLDRSQTDPEGDQPSAPGVDDPSDPI